MTLPALIAQTRALDAGLDVAEKDLSVVGANSSTRLPIRIQTATGQVEGFFTEDYKVLDPKGIYAELRGKGYYTNPAFARMFDKADMGYFNEDDFVNDLSGMQAQKG